MRFYGMALVTGALALAACGGGDTATTDTAAIDTAAGTPAAGAPAGDVAAAAPTGTIHTVNMVLDNGTYKYDPAEITVAPGDGIRYVMVSGGPHNVHFDSTDVASAAGAQLNANIPNKMGDLMSTYLTNPNEEVVVSFTNVPAGRYPYVCDPHAAMNMRGAVTVQ